MTVADRAGLVSDVFALADRNRVAADLPLAFTQFMAQDEITYPVWVAFIEGIGPAIQRLQTHASFPRFLTYLRSMYGTIYAHATGSAAGNDHLAGLLRAEISAVACQGDNEEEEEEEEKGKEQKKKVNWPNQLL